MAVDHAVIVVCLAGMLAMGWWGIAGRLARAAGGAGRGGPDDGAAAEAPAEPSPSGV
ncbi:hypothetical protein RI138_10040 [Streptomyces sp. C11-1]|uniref:Uncharacterized protein n=1 Tax=Streptomyces durocortorensis TaxID=2811104 RepID=A0ABY9VT96_9ACTN|nr:hypothetical protein [Streptomyces durocortorensis]WNF27154.1 hypothetical protein RI138_10040 [Streptomyces durocortorensis]